MDIGSGIYSMDFIGIGARSEMAGSGPMGCGPIYSLRNAAMLAEILNCDRLTAIVDVGASPIDGEVPYKDMLDKRLCTVRGFEPNPEFLDALNANKTDLETYSGEAIGWDGTATLRTFSTPGMNSLLAPNPETMAAFPGFKAFAVPAEVVQTQVHRLDDMKIPHMDLLKVDVQGGEGSVFTNAPSLMAKVVAVHTEVPFITLYKDQPTFGEIDLELRHWGLVPHTFAEIKHWVISPLLGACPHPRNHQLLEADIVYVRDFTKMDLMSDDQLKHLAMIAHYVYGSTDLVIRCLTWLTKRDILPSGMAQEYLKWSTTQRTQ